MTEHKNIASALAAAQASMGKALKQANNPHFRSKYADLGNVMDACLPALNAAGIALIQPTGEDETGRYVETVFIHGASGERLSCRVPLIVSKNDMQAFGSAVTYARRYGLMAMAGIAPEDDDGHAAAQAAPPQGNQQRRQAPSPQQPAPQSGPAPQAIKAAVEYLGEAESFDDLRDRWGKLPKDVATQDEVTKAKDQKKAALEVLAQAVAPQPAPQPAPDLGGDEIPFM